jgi:hypothetical protein
MRGLELNGLELNGLEFAFCGSFPTSQTRAFYTQAFCARAPQARSPHTRPPAPPPLRDKPGLESWCLRGCGREPSSTLEWMADGTPAALTALISALLKRLIAAGRKGASQQISLPGMCAPRALPPRPAAPDSYSMNTRGPAEATERRVSSAAAKIECSAIASSAVRSDRIRSGAPVACFAATPPVAQSVLPRAL